MQKISMKMKSHDIVELYVFEGHDDVYLHVQDGTDDSTAAAKLTTVEARYLIEQLTAQVKVAELNAERV